MLSLTFVRQFLLCWTNFFCIFTLAFFLELRNKYQALFVFLNITSKRQSIVLGFLIFYYWTHCFLQLWSLSYTPKLVVYLVGHYTSPDIDIYIGIVEELINHKAEKKPWDVHPLSKLFKAINDDKKWCSLSDKITTCVYSAQ